MNIPPSEADRLDLPTYETVLQHWNEAHDMGNDAEAPDAETTMVLLDKINADPRLIN